MPISEHERKDIHDMLVFWFGDPDTPEFGRNRNEWWVQSDEFDAHIEETMLPYHMRAAEGDLDQWVFEPEAGLALIILLDQVPRNMFRGTARAFASDHKALGASRQYIGLGLDSLMSAVHRLFVYLPFEHAENMADQLRSVSLMSDLKVSGVRQSAWRHREIIDRFGRFPHRNEALRRTSTMAEREFLTQPNSSF